MRRWPTERLKWLRSPARRRWIYSGPLARRADWVRVRNLVGLPQFAFWLPTSTDYFYPDFVCELENGRLLVVEHKGEHLVAGELEKRQVGEAWAGSSDGKCLLLMAVKKDEAGRGVSAQRDAVIGRS